MNRVKDFGRFLREVYGGEGAIIAIMGAAFGLLISSIILSIAGCGGWGGDATLRLDRTFALRGGNVTQGVDFHTTSFSPDATVTSFTWDIPRNAGGGGSIGVGFTAYGGECSTATPVDTITIPAGTTVGPTSATALILDAINTYKDVVDYTACFILVPADLAAPIDIDLHVVASATEHIGL